MNKPPNEVDRAPGEGAPAGEKGLTFKVLVFAFTAYFVAPLVLVCLYASGNFYTRMEQWYAMNISLQSVDPTRVAIDDPEADMEILNSLMSPELRAAGFAQALHERWRADRLWAIREGDLEAFAITDDTAMVEILLRMDMATAEGTHFREVRETTQWKKIDGSWYLADLNDDLVEERFTPWPGIVMP